MTALASYLSTFLREHLPKERRASPHTCEAYAASFTLLVCFAAERLKIRPFKLEIEQLDVPMILAFLEHIESQACRDQRLLPISGIPATVLPRSGAARARHSDEEDRSSSDRLLDARRDARAARRARSTNRVRSAGSRDAAPDIRGRLARLGTCRLASRPARTGDGVGRSCHGQGQA